MQLYRISSLITITTAGPTFSENLGKRERRINRDALSDNENAKITTSQSSSLTLEETQKRHFK